MLRPTIVKGPVLSNERLSVSPHFSFLRQLALTSSQSLHQLPRISRSCSLCSYNFPTRSTVHPNYSLVFELTPQDRHCKRLPTETPLPYGKIH